MNYYTGVGSRATPPEVLAQMVTIAENMRSRGWTLRSGGAEGADEAFERGAGSLKEIYLPWRLFRSHPSVLFGISTEAYEIAEDIHPAWHRLTPGAKKLHARNVHQVLGTDLRTPSQQLVCWTPGGEEVGGTRTAIVLARRRGIEMVNLWSPGP